MRSRHLWGAALAVPVLMSLVGCASAPPPAAEKAAQPAAPVFKPVVSVNDVMVGVVDHNAHILWNVGDPKKAPKKEADWHALEHAATTLAAAGSIVEMGGSGPDDKKWAADPEWTRLNQVMTNAALKAKLAVDGKNLEQVLAAGDDLVMSCEGCHAKFKPAIPAHVATKDQQPEHFGH
jgi:cytochrome c556